MPTQAEVDALRNQALAKQQEAEALAARRGEIDAEIAEARQGIAEARIAAARAGESVTDAGDRAALQALLDEADTLPEEHLAARLEAVGAFVVAESGQLQVYAPQVATAKSNYLAAKATADAAVAAAETSKTAYWSIDRAHGIASERLREHEDLLRTIEQQGVVTLT